MPSHITRRALGVVEARLADEPVIALSGPRAVGKSTLLAEIADRRDVTVIDLDEPAVRAAVVADPATFVSGSAPVCIDEFQKAPGVLDAIKAVLNRRLSPGMFVLTGSTRFDALPRAAQALTGRIHLIELLPFSQGELDGVHEDFLDTALREPPRLITPRRSTTARAEYIERICRGGMPLAVARAEATRDRWFDDYVNMSLRRDATDLSRIRHAAALPRLLQRLAGQTAQMLDITKAAQSLDVERRTADSYTKLLEDLLLVRRLPAWGRTLRARAVARPKIHVIDSGLAAHLLRLNADKLARLEPASLTEFGHLLETFVVGELLKQVSWSDTVATTGHWRTHDNQEADFVVEHHDGLVTAFEVKAASQVQRRDASGLFSLRDALRGSFNAGILLYTGELSYQLDERILVIPIDRLWTPFAPTRPSDT